MEKTASRKVIMNKEQLLLFVENKQKEDFRRDSLLPENENILKEDSRRAFLLPVVSLSMDKTESSKVIVSDEDSTRAIKALFSVFDKRISKDKMEALGLKEWLKSL